MTERSHITLILDRTGSMQDIREDVVGGFNAFLAQQQAAPDPATFTLVQFDSQDPYEVLHSMVPISSAPPLTLERYVPRASTPLYDAMGRGILDLEAQLAALPESGRPTKVIFVVVTDGQENASREFDRSRVTVLIDAKKGLGWDFVFLSADLAAFQDAQHMGVDAASSLLFSRSKAGNDRAWDAASNKIFARRTGVADKVVFDDEDRKASE
ncbi:MAG: VWA domain-containing protein [Thermomonas sp.]|uniref:hypothetical protein n=1 Tax=Thermomonas sp. TaxID=1971895 RepID=UPI00262B0651|nr:hypothetical protein [Thermomonas sp.]MCC7097826.1 VWA domain-containing protein [Thermomonas sp.]